MVISRGSGLENDPGNDSSGSSPQRIKHGSKLAKLGTYPSGKLPSRATVDGCKRSLFRVSSSYVSFALSERKARVRVLIRVSLVISSILCSRD